MPTVAFAVAALLAVPEAFVDTVPAGSVAEAPDPGAVKVTVAPGTRLPPASRTVTTSAAANAVLTWADCPPPEVELIDAAAPAVLVSPKLVVVATPAALAVTL